MQMTGKCIQVTSDEIKDFLAKEVLLVLFKCQHMWTIGLKIYDEKIASIKPLKRYQTIRRFIHFVDNSNQSIDRYLKIRPVLESIRKTCVALDQERCSTDEMTIPYKGTTAGSRRKYIKNKPKKWSFKILLDVAYLVLFIISCCMAAKTHFQDFLL